ncbi:MAG TPA: putative baseplate assembly protein [Trichocoleus sp.]|jgi:uncharacterized phage protein gp47/JayE
MTTDPTEFSPDEAPFAHDNPPGMSAIAYRQGTHATVFQRLLSRLRQQEILDAETKTLKRPLQALSIHDRDDPGIALLDTWAMVADVLSFYQERIANEGYLRTAIEDRSILELSRAIGYELRPGVAASTPLVFTVEDAPGSEPQVLVPQGTQVQSIPTQPGEVPQTFETVEDLQARVEWNCLTPYLEQESKIYLEQEPEIITPRTTELKLQGTNTLLRSGDTILIKGNEQITNETNARQYLQMLKTVEPNLQEGYTKITWSDTNLPTPPQPQVFAFRQRASLFGYNAPEWNNLMIVKGKGKIASTSNTEIRGSETSFQSQLKVGDIIIVNNQVKKIVTLTGNDKLEVETPFVPLINSGTEFYFTQRNDPDSTRANEWNNFHLQRTEIDLDAVYSGILPQSWVVLSQQNPSQKTKLCRVNYTSIVFRSDFKLAGKITRIGVDLDSELEQFDLRNTSVLFQSEELGLFKKTTLKSPIQKKGRKTTIALNRVSPYLKPEQPVILSSKNNAIEVVTVEKIEDKDGYTELTIKELIEPEIYDSETLKIYGNVVLANHGETIADEVLGSGDGTKANQQFTLKKPPLTYISTTTSTGIQSTLKIYVNQVLWQQVQSLHNQNARSQCYVVQTNEQGQTRIIFGDGIQGARLPSGQENVRATYRSGIGQAGEVKAGSLILLQNRPLGIREVTNPIAASGAADRDSFDIVRKNAPRTVLTLDHVVSLRDFENFARSFAGIGKAQATQIWTGEMRQIYITVADVDGQAASPALCNTLQDAIAVAGNTLQPVKVASYVPKECLFNLEAKILVDDRYRFENVKPQILQALRQAFSFQAREFGQGVAASEVIQVIQGVEGVVAVDLNAFYLASQQKDANQTKQLKSFLVAKLARWESNAKPAQILLLNPDEKQVVLQEWA